MIRLHLRKVLSIIFSFLVIATILKFRQFFLQNTSLQSTSVENDKTQLQKQAMRQLNSYKYSRRQKNKTAPDVQFDLYIEDIFIAVKSTKDHHSKRLNLLLDTWIPQASSSVYIITDGEDERYSKIFGKEHFIETPCGASHSKKDLTCKLQAIYDVYLSKEAKYKWLCSVDDDNYVLVPNLVKTLRKYDYNKDWYIGKPSLPHKYSTIENNGMQTKKISYWFATGGAGLCISRALAKRMFALCGEGRFQQRAKDIEETDDTTIGYVINHLLGVVLTIIPEFHSHIEPLWEINSKDFHKQVTLSWGKVTASGGVIIPNRVLINDEIKKYPTSLDKTRMLSLHCHFYPSSKQCERIIDKLGDPK